MPTPRKLPMLAVLAAAAALLLLPAAAQASLTFVRGQLDRSVYVARDDGSGVRKVGPGDSPHMAPDGQWVAYLREASPGKPELRLAPVARGPGRTLMKGWREPFDLEFSPNGEQILALRGGELGKRKLVLVTIATGAQKVLSSGYFSGFSFDPEGKEIVFAKSNSERYPPRSDVFRVPVSGGKAVALTKDHRSLDPLWGPTGRIAFVKLLGASQRRYGPKNEIYLMKPDGKGVKRLTRTVVDPLLQGLFPTAWSGDGKRLLTEFTGQDTSYAVGVNAQTGAQKPIGPVGESGFVGTALSADGRTVLGFEGGFDPAGKHTVVTRPFGGGKAKVLVRNAYEPDWSF